MRTYLVTGGAGFIGSNYIHYMFKKYGNDIRIINVDALTYAGNLENLMACGLGACLCCVEKTGEGHNVCVCKEGPVFNTATLSWLN